MKKKKILLGMVLSAVFAAVCAVCAWITVPSVVPFTMQTFAVFVTLGLLGGKLGTAAIALYLLLGAVGIPVFAGFTGGFGRLIGATGGYLVGFLAICVCVWISEKISSSFWCLLAAMAVGLALCYLFGTLWYVTVFAKTKPIGFGSALMTCVVPFILPDLAKLAVAAIITKRLKPAIKKIV